MSNMFEGMTISFPNLMDVRIVPAHTEFKRGMIDYCGHFEYTAPTKKSLKVLGIEDVVLKIHFAVNIVAGAKVSFDELTASVNKAVDALTYVAHLVKPSGWVLSDEYHVVSADELFPQPKVAENKRRDIVDTWTTNEIRMLGGRLDGGKHWVRLEDYERKVAELEKQLPRAAR